MSHLTSAPKPRSKSADPSAHVIDGIESRIRNAILQDLTTEQRLLILLWHAEGMTPEEIGVILNTTAERVQEIHESLIVRIREAADAPVACA